MSPGLFFLLTVGALLEEAIRYIYDWIISKRVGVILRVRAGQGFKDSSEILYMNTDNKVERMVKVWNAPWAMKELGWI